ncbi:MAG: hypothetical protein F9K24_20290 [Leptonema illini]|uniref:Immunity MXAN-0049 protein domain-containing protein n=1 Tax=Leptonema illini TaxID=183 RepID=A0A833GXS5_9LEPT|nr:MAG: hypothetical protein F9K24_20290 [Leptonema illini]
MVVPERQLQRKYISALKEYQKTGKISEEVRQAIRGDVLQALEELNTRLIEEDGALYHDKDYVILGELKGENTMAMKYYHAYMARESGVHLADDDFWGHDFIADTDIKANRPVRCILERAKLSQDFINVRSAFLVSSKLYEIFVKLTDNYKTYPAVIAKKDGMITDDYRIFYIGDEIGCFNWERSVYDGRNEELNMPLSLRTVVLDKSKLPEYEGKNIFRLKEMDCAIIVNDYAKKMLEKAKITGFIYEELAVE